MFRDLFCRRTKKAATFQLLPFFCVYSLKWQHNIQSYTEQNINAFLCESEAQAKQEGLVDMPKYHVHMTQSFFLLFFCDL